VTAVPAYPILLAVAFVITKFLEIGAPLQVVNRPLAIALFTIAGLQAVVGMVGGRHRAAYFVALGFLVLFDVLVAALLLAAAIVSLAWRSVQHRRLMVVDWPVLTRRLNAFGGLLLVVTIAPGAFGGAFRYASVPPSMASVAALDGSLPDVYMILLDGYPRADTLREDFGYDNEPFLSAMRGLGFEVSDRAHSNYTHTGLTLSTMFNARHLAELMPEPPRDAVAQARIISEFINDGAALTAARRVGY
jgi:hypothetical protein